MIQILLHGLKMDPLVSLHYYAPVCAAINLIALPFTEGLAPFYEVARIGPLIMLSNAFVAFLLNVAAVFLVGVGSGLVLTLAGVFKVCVSLSIVLFLISSYRISSSSRALCSSLGPPLHRCRCLGMRLRWAGLFCSNSRAESD